MPISEQAKAALSKSRGQASTYISDPKQRAAYVSEQGELEKKGQLSDQKAQALQKDAENTIATQGENKKNNTGGVLGSFKKGGNVKKTGVYRLHAGERVLNRKQTKNWIAGAIKHPGAEKRAAAKAGMSTHAYMEEHKNDSGKAGQRARLGLTLSGMNK